MWMCAVVIAVVGLVGCGAKGGGNTVDDACKVVLGDPSHAVAAMTQRYPGDAVKVAEIVERCVAPTGDDCERLAKIVAAIPSMMPSSKAPGGDVAGTCRDMPLEMRRCMLPSYALAHADECRKVRDTIASTYLDSIAIKPGGARVPSCEPVALAVRADGLRIATRADGRCFRARADGRLDLAWLEAELKAALGLDCAPSLEIGTTADVKYQEVISVMDVAMKAGIVDLAVASMAELSVKLDGDPTQDAAHCPAMVVSKEPAQASPPGPSSRSALANAPVVVVTRDEVLVAGEHVASIAELAQGEGTIAALVAALPTAPANRSIILQADERTDMKVVVRTIETLKGAGYDNVMFAVKTK